MEIVKLIFKIILTIIRIPFTIWYVVMGGPLKAFVLMAALMERIAAKFGVSALTIFDKSFSMMSAILLFEWASLVKFYHFHW